MSGSARLDRRLADTPRTPWDTSAVTCSTDQADTSSAHHFDLPRVRGNNVGRGFTNLTRVDRFFQVLNCLLLTAEAITLLVMQPSKLLKNSCMIRIPVQHTSVC